MPQEQSLEEQLQQARAAAHAAYTRWLQRTQRGQTEEPAPAHNTNAAAGQKRPRGGGRARRASRKPKALGVADLYSSLRPTWLTIADLEAMPVNRPQDILCFDRNWLDRIDSDGIPWRDHKKTYTPPRMLRAARIQLTRLTPARSSKVRLAWRWPDRHTANDSIHVLFDMPCANCGKTHGYWYPLTDKGTVPRPHETQSNERLPHAGKHWTQLPKSMHVGWRGPMVRASVLDILPRLYVGRTEYE